MSIKKTLVAIALFVCISNVVTAQSDTSYFYLGDYGLTVKDSATSCLKIYKDNGRWTGREYYITTGILKSEGYYRDSNYTSPVGTFKNYSDDGKLFNITVLEENSNLLSRIYFYKNGNKQSQQSKNDDGSYSLECWDSLGNKQNNCEVTAEARFKGGLKGWKKFIDKNINDTRIIDAGVPKGTYTVTVRFSVEKDGTLSHIEAEENSGVCEPCTEEVLNTFKKSPAWQPAMQNEMPFVFSGSENVTIIVVKEKKPKKHF